MLCMFQKCCTFAPSNKKDDNRSFDFGLWCNGNTTDSGPVFLGSNPSSPTKSCSDFSEQLFCFLLFYICRGEYMVTFYWGTL